MLSSSNQLSYRSEVEQIQQEQEKVQEEVPPQHAPKGFSAPEQYMGCTFNFYNGKD